MGVFIYILFAAMLRVCILVFVKLILKKVCFGHACSPLKERAAVGEGVDRSLGVSLWYRMTSF